MPQKTEHVLTYSSVAWASTYRKLLLLVLIVCVLDVPRAKPPCIRINLIAQCRVVERGRE